MKSPPYKLFYCKLPLAKQSSHMHCRKTKPTTMYSVHAGFTCGTHTLCRFVGDRFPVMTLEGNCCTSTSNKSRFGLLKHSHGEFDGVPTTPQATPWPRLRNSRKQAMLIRASHFTRTGKHLTASDTNISQTHEHNTLSTHDQFLRHGILT